MYNSIRGSRNIITGCGGGLGKATLEWFLARDSGPILAIDRRIDEEELDLNESQRKKVIFKRHDTFSEETEKSIQDFVAEHKSIDNIINVAGVALAFVTWRSTQEHPFESGHINHLLDFNTYGTFNVTRLASKYMIQDPDRETSKRTKCIINTSCISTTNPVLGQCFYSASKSAIDATTLCLARELSPFGIRCNTINVGFFDTNLTKLDEEVRTHVKESHLAPRRLGHPDEFAHLVQAIIENHMINGSCIRIDAGLRELPI